MKPEYDFSKMKRTGHPLREKVTRGEIKLTSPFDIPDWEAKLAALPPDEREGVKKFLESYKNEKMSLAV